MDLSNRLVNLAKRTLPVSREFDELIRSIGECKSKVWGQGRGWGGGPGEGREGCQGACVPRGCTDKDAGAQRGTRLRPPPAPCWPCASPACTP